MAKGGVAAISTAWGVTPQGQNTGISPGRIVTESPKSGLPISLIPMEEGSPRCRGLPWTRGMAEVTQLPVVNLLRRTKNRTSQTRLSGEERRKNAEGIYKAISIPDEWRGKHLMLVDDVMTTGSTLANCAAALHEADPSLLISVLPLAFAGE